MLRKVSRIVGATVLVITGLLFLVSTVTTQIDAATTAPVLIPCSAFGCNGGPDKCITIGMIMGSITVEVTCYTRAS